MEYGCGGDLASPMPLITTIDGYKIDLPKIKNILWQVLLGLE